MMNYALSLSSGSDSHTRDIMHVFVQDGPYGCGDVAYQIRCTSSLPTALPKPRVSEI